MLSNAAQAYERLDKTPSRQRNEAEIRMLLQQVDEQIEKAELEATIQ